MADRQPLPTRWLMTDERMGDALWRALHRLPAGSGVVFRHYGLPPTERQAVFRRVAAIARRRRLLLLRAGPTRLGRGEAGVHNGRSDRIITASAHNRAEAITAVRRGATLLFVSPVFGTRSHPDARVLGARRLRSSYAGLDVTIIALGGMNEARFRRLRPLGVHGWAGIDAWTRDQKRNAVPT